ncbi:MAG: hypothetical protein U0229_07210 [Anaeromyxobacter sp.]
MPTCFVIQPFDGGKFDKRFNDVYAPAVKAADLDAYRVDRDPSVSIPIESIEKGIRDAAVCLAEITLDNPNVWFELGFALACGKEVIPICSKEREGRFPFDIQHRNVITYMTESGSDFEQLQKRITERLRAAMKKGRDLDKLAETPLRGSEGLKPHEIACLAVVMQNTSTPGIGVFPYTITNDMQRAGFTALAANLALHSLLKKGMVAIFEGRDERGEHFTGYEIRPPGHDWLEANQDALDLREGDGGSSPQDIPF